MTAAAADRPRREDPKSTPAVEPETYVVERIREALAHDARVSQLGVGVSVAGGKIFLSGETATPERKTAATEVARARAEGRAVYNAMTVLALSEPSEREELE